MPLTQMRSPTCAPARVRTFPLWVSPRAVTSMKRPAGEETMSPPSYHHVVRGGKGIDTSIEVFEIGDTLVSSQSKRDGRNLWNRAHRGQIR